MISAILIDDEPHCLRALVHDLKRYCPEVQIADTCTSAKEGILSIRNHAPQLVFLDVEMPWMNGFEMLEILGEAIAFQTIFTTAYSEFAARAFRVSAVDYLLKPVNGDDLAQAVGKVQKMLHTGEGTGAAIANLLGNARQSAERQRLAVPSRDGYDFVAVGEIVYCKAEGAYSHLFLPQKRLVLSKPLGEVEQLLPHTLFERVHHSILVNLQHVAGLRKSEGLSIVMDNGDVLPLAKGKKDALMARMGLR